MPRLTSLLNIDVIMKEKEDINTEQSIMAAAEKEFLDKGFALTKTTDIAKLAGVNHAMLHYYFRTKENLFNKVFQKKVSIITNSFISKVQKDLPFTEKVSFIIEEHFNFLVSNPKLPFFILNEFITNKSRLIWFRNLAAPAIGAIINELKADIDVEVEKGTICPIDPVNLIMDIVSLNVFVFVAHPLIKEVASYLNRDYKLFLEQKKAENVLVILKRLQV